MNKSKKTDRKQGKTGLARDENAKEKRDLNISSTGPAVYAAVDKLKKKKSKKAAVGIATEASNTNYRDSQKPPALPAVYAAVEITNRKQGKNCWELTRQQIKQMQTSFPLQRLKTKFPHVHLLLSMQVLISLKRVHAIMREL